MCVSACVRACACVCVGGGGAGVEEAGMQVIVCSNVRC